MNTDLAYAVAIAVERLQEQVTEHAAAISLETGAPKADARAAIMFALAPPPARDIGDQRAVPWQVRFRIYSEKDGFAEPVADSDPDLPAGELGAEVIRGLPIVGDTAAAMAHEFHNVGPLRGLDQDTLAKKILGLRPTLSRRDGNAVWRLYYDTPDTFKLAAPHNKGGWMLRIDLQRQGAARPGAGTRQSTPTHPVEEKPQPRGWLARALDKAGVEAAHD